MSAFVSIYLIYISSSLASCLLHRTLCCRQDTWHFSFLLYWIRKTEQRLIFSSPSQVIKGIKGPAMYESYCFQLNLWVSNSASTSEVASSWTSNKHVLQQPWLHFQVEDGQTWLRQNHTLSSKILPWQRRNLLKPTGYVTHQQV